MGLRWNFQCGPLKLLGFVGTSLMQSNRLFGVEAYIVTGNARVHVEIPLVDLTGYMFILDVMRCFHCEQFKIQ